jgi:hypothetical protein
MQRVKIEGQVLSLREAEQVWIALIVLERERWTIDDLTKILGLRDYGLDIAKDLRVAMGIDNEAVVAFFGPRGEHGWKLEQSGTLSKVDVNDCRRQHKLVYGHGPSNGYFLATFLRAWLAEKKNHKVNWAKFAYDVLRRQLKLRKNVENKKLKMESMDRTPSSSKQSSFSDWMDGSPKVSPSLPSVLQNYDSLACLGPLCFSTAFPR